MFRWSSSVLKSEPASTIIWLEEFGTSYASFHYILTSVVNSVFEWEQSSCHYLLSHFNSLRNWLRSLFYSSPNHRKMKKNFSVTEGLNLGPYPWDFNLAIDWHTNNLSHHGWAKFHQFFILFDFYPFAFFPNWVNLFHLSEE